MYKRILASKNLTFKEKIKALFDLYRRRRGARILWKDWFRIRYKHFPENFVPVEKAIEREYCSYWKSFRRHVSCKTLRLSHGISGVANPHYIPEDIFMSDIEPTLNQTASAVLLSYKSFYNHWFPCNIFPEDFVHNIDGQWMDHTLNPISFDQVKSIASRLEYPVVLKPNKDTYGGRNVHFPKSSSELIKLIRKKTNCLIQERISQHDFFNRYNSHGINSVRANVYRSVKDNQLHILGFGFRMGVGGSLDNLQAGGITTKINMDGRLAGYAINYLGTKFYEHPDSGMPFDQEIPDFEQLKAICLLVASKLLYARIISLDLCYDSSGQWKMIEVNINSTTLLFAQLFGEPFFNQFTDEVRDYCISNHWTLKHKRC